VKYDFIFINRPIYPMTLMCWVLGVTKGGFLHWRNHSHSARAKRDADLTRQ
jgi:hypothetical protein